VIIPFGKYRFTPLVEVPAEYLNWLLRNCKLSARLRLAVANELRRRNLEAPPPPAAVKIPHCSHCGNTLYDCRWQQDRAGRKCIRVECRWCHKFLAFAPMIPLFTDQADRNASPALALNSTSSSFLGVNHASRHRQNPQ
jgi:hypothetical protein